MGSCPVKNILRLEVFLKNSDKDGFLGVRSNAATTFFVFFLSDMVPLVSAGRFGFILTD